MPLFFAALGLILSPLQSAEDWRSSALKASGIEVDQSAWVLQGTDQNQGNTQKFTFQLGPGNGYLWDSEGPLSQREGGDGATCWVASFSGRPHLLNLGGKDTSRLIPMIVSGEWAVSGSGIQVQKKEQSAFSLKFSDGVLTADLTLDPLSHLPKSVSYWTAAGTETWSFLNYKPFDKRVFPTRFERHVGSVSEIVAIEDGKAVAASAPPMPAPSLGDTVYDSAVSPSVEVKRVGPYVFIHPKVNGKDVGWFFIDSGADCMVIDSAIAKKLGLKSVGSDIVAGVVAVQKMGFDRGSSFQAGPVTYQNPTFLELDMSSISQAIGMPVGGVCGYDFIARTIVDFNPKTNVLKFLAKPESVASQKWTPIVFDSNTPSLWCEFEGGHKGWFHLDTGSSSTVDLFANVVESLKLLNGRKTDEAMTAGAGGAVKSYTGPLAYFDLAGHRFENRTVGFQVAKQGVFASPIMAGNIGMGFLGQCHLVFDYTHSRMQFLPE